MTYKMQLQPKKPKSIEKLRRVLHTHCNKGSSQPTSATSPPPHSVVAGPMDGLPWHTCNALLEPLHGSTVLFGEHLEYVWKNDFSEISPIHLGRG